ncbi:secreted protein [Candidatus Magnetobacterium bavaricum]|uniref:Secreted protein n=1 Tax=Candidatus Magnetobacterium bavaricum TaxID=29290 RepID=A0A0F3GW93_9BACT|nr:secreted protein [Candidatus Magnetobacterium bavaricum]
MKRSIVYLMLLLVALFGVSMWTGGASTVTAADVVSYMLPYMATSTTTAASRVMDCVVSNMTSDNVTVGFTVTAKAAGQSSSSAATLTNNIVPPGATRIVQFSGTSVKLTDSAGTATAMNATALSVDGSYGGILTFTSANLNTTANSTSGLSCELIPIACFQGNTSPRRNLVGYVCTHSNTAVGGSNAHYTY